MGKSLSTLRAVVKMGVCCLSIRGWEEFTSLSMPLREWLLQPITTACVAAIVQRLLNASGSHWIIILILKQLRLMFPRMAKLVGPTCISWIVLYCVLSWSSLQHPSRDWNHPAFKKLTGWFNTLNYNGVSPVNEYNAGHCAPKGINVICNPAIYHPDKTCQEHATVTLINQITACVQMYPLAYSVIGLLRSRQLLIQHPIQWISNVLFQSLHSTGYAIAMGQGNRLLPCVLKWLNYSKRIQTMFEQPQDWLRHSPIIQTTIGMLFIAISACVMYIAEHPRQRTSIWDYTFGYLVLSVLSWIRLSETNLASLLSGAFFFLLRYQYMKHQSSLSNNMFQVASRFMFVQK